MREIKFRGLTANNEWVYGDLIHDREGLTSYYKDYPCRIHWFREDGASCNQPIRKGTEGEFTGLKDKNGKEIYEGDICFAPIPRQKYVVKFGEYASEYNDTDDRLPDAYGFYIECFDNKYHKPKDMQEGFCDANKYLEVIGNIYENHELLEKK